MFKKIKLIGMLCLMMAAMVAFSSCSKEKQMVGKWVVTKGSVCGESIPKGSFWTFKDGGKCVLEIWDTDYEGHYSVKKNTLTINVEYDFDGEIVGYYGDLDIDEFSNKDKNMSVSGKLTQFYRDEYYSDEEEGPCKFSVDLEKK